MGVFPLHSVNEHGIGEDVSKCVQNSWSGGGLFSTRATATNIDDGKGNQVLANVWPEIQGVKWWKGLLDRMDPLLKAEILRYGNFAKICYDSFDGDRNSKYYGSCKYSKATLLERVGMPNSGYKVTKYLYANTDVLSSLFGEKGREEKGVWIGFVAVSNDPEEIRRLGRRDIIVAWRGTQTPQEWVEDLRDILVPARLSHGTDATSSLHASSSVRIEKGFLSCYTSSIIGEVEDSMRMSARESVMAEMSRLVLKEYKDQRLSITLTGHSLGAALATLNSYDIKRFLVNAGIDIPVTVFAFASPRVGNMAFAQHMEEIGVRVLRVVNDRDVVPKVPGILINEKFGWLAKRLSWLPWTYSHVGVQLTLRDKSSPFLMPTRNLAYFHNIEVYLHLLDALVGHGNSFRSSLQRTAFVKKRCHFLTRGLQIVSTWWQEVNKGLLKYMHCEWTQSHRLSPTIHRLG